MNSGSSFSILPVSCRLGNLAFDYDGPLVFLNYLKESQPDLFKRSLEAIHSPLVQKESNLEVQILAFNHLLADKVIEQLKLNQFPIIIGGDHSIAMGTWSALTSYYQATQKFGLIWIDAHLDLHSFETSPSGNVHGMPLAYLLGLEEHEFKHIVSKEAKLLPEHLIFIGARDYEAEEWERIERLGIKVYQADEVHERGFKIIFEEAYQMLSSKVEMMGVSLDLDVFDPIYTVDVATPVPNGLVPCEIYEVFKNYAGDSKIKAFEIVEFTPKENGMKTNEILYNLIKSFTIS